MKLVLIVLAFICVWALGAGSLAALAVAMRPSPSPPVACGWDDNHWPPFRRGHVPPAGV